MDSDPQMTKVAMFNCPTHGWESDPCGQGCKPENRGRWMWFTPMTDDEVSRLLLDRSVERLLEEHADTWRALADA